MWLILGTKGGHNRARIINALHDKPANTNNLKNQLNLNYKTVSHHLKILEEMNVVNTAGKDYGKIYFLSEKMEKNYDEFEKIWQQLEE